MKKNYIILVLLVSIVFNACQKDESVFTLGRPHGGLDIPTTNIESSYPIEYPIRGVYNYLTDCQTDRDTSFPHTATIRFVTPDSICLYNVFDYFWNDTLITFKLDSTNSFHFTAHHRQSDFQLSGDSIYYLKHVFYCTINSGCEIWNVDTIYTGVIVR